MPSGIPINKRALSLRALKGPLSRFFIFSPFILLGASLLRAAAPAEINYQGKLTNASGNPENGSFNMTFRIYNAANGGNQCFQDVRSGVGVVNGVFSVLIGSTITGGIPSHVFLGGTGAPCPDPAVGRWLQVTVGTTDLLPRQKLVAAPYALSVAAGSVGTNEIADGGVDTVDLANGAVTGPKLGPDAVTGDKITDGTIGNADIADGAIADAKISGGISLSKLAGGTANINISGNAGAADGLSGKGIIYLTGSNPTCPGGYSIMMRKWASLTCISPSACSPGNGPSSCSAGGWGQEGLCFHYHNDTSGICQPLPCKSLSWSAVFCVAN
jgi:hypothetical protein